MLKNLDEKFRSHCNKKNLEINLNQINTIKKLEYYYKDNFKSSFFNLFSKDVK